MASLYDAILVRGSLRYRLNKVFVGEDKVPQHVKDVLTADNIVDENGMIIVDQKNEEAKKPTEDNEAEIEDGNKLPRVDGNDDSSDAPTKTTDQVPAVDDSANENQTQEGDSNATSPSVSAEEAGKSAAAPVAQVAPEQPTQEPAPAPAPAPQAQAPAEPARTAAPQQPVEVFRSKVPQSSPGMGFPRKNGKTVDIFDLKTPHTHVKLIGTLAVPLSAESFRTKTEGQIQARLQELGFEIHDFNALERQQMMSQAADPNLLLDEDDVVEDDIQLG